MRPATSRNFPVIPGPGKCNPQLCEISNNDHFAFERIDCDGVGILERPLVLSFNAGSELADQVLAIFDGAGNELTTIPASDASSTASGVCFFEFTVDELPDPFEARWRDRDAESHVAGPCSPADLRNALVRGDNEAAERLAIPPNDDA